MNTERKPYCVNQIMKGEIIFERGSEAAYVGLVLKGRVRIQAEGVNLVIGSGHFLGLTDLQDGMYRVTYQAETDLAIYIFRAGELQATLQQIFKANKDYAALMVATLGKYIHALAGVYHTLEEQAERDYEFLQEQYRSYQMIGQELGITTDELPGIEELSPLMHWTALDEEKITYYDILSGLKQDVQKAYFGASETIAVYHIKDQINLLRDLLDQCEADAAYLQSLVGPMFRTDKNLYLSVLHMVATAKRIDADTKAGMEIFDKLIDEINRLEEVLYEQASINLQIDHNSMDNAYYSLICDGASQEETVDTLTEEFALVEENFVSVEELDHSLEHILRYSELPIEQTQQFEADVRAFAALSDKMSTDDNARELRRNILKQYYPLYKAVYYKEYHSTEETPIEIDLFLRYGFLSETLLTEELLEELLSLDNDRSGRGDCRVYDMKEWLTEVYEGRKSPSKSEFDLDYEDFLRDQKKTGRITEAQMKEQLEDRDAKLDYEITNMFRVNHRLVSGQASVFVPFLFTEGSSASLQRTFLSKDKINASLRKLRQIDYSVFYRELLFHKDDSPITKEYMMEEVAPDVILLPACGTKGIMWQELSGRRRNSKGRFLMPHFFEGDLELAMIQLCGRFRWELCRTMQGTSWNNIQIKSLTSEYSDYIQFYRKNRDLSEDKKEKLKMQIQKCRNNTREVFVTDYINWIRHEAKGGITLNKTVREIMATYCAFTKKIRETIVEQPLFRDAMARFMRETGKKNKEYALKFRVWEKDGIEVPAEIIQTRDFYRDL